MEKVKKFAKSEIFILIFSIIIAVVIVSLFFGSMRNQMIETADITPAILKEYAMEVARTLDEECITDERIKVDKDIGEDFIKITVETFSCYIKATFPTSTEIVINENSQAQIITSVIYEPEYSEFSKSQTIVQKSILMIILGLVIFFGVYVILHTIFVRNEDNYCYDETENNNDYEDYDYYDDYNDYESYEDYNH